MNPFSYERVSNVAVALARGRGVPGAAYLAGGTELLNWMRDGIARPSLLIDITQLPLAAIEDLGEGLRIGALVRLSQVAADSRVRTRFPAIAEALEGSASPQLRNMATVGGNLLQRTQCPYFRSAAPAPCNQRVPGTGCSALQGENRTHAIFGWSDACVATHPSDLAVALAALDAVVELAGAEGVRSVSLEEFYHRDSGSPGWDPALRPAELVTAVRVDGAAAGSCYLKLRERASFDFALVSAAAVVEAGEGGIRAARVALGGVAPRPWRLRAAERRLAGAPLEIETLRRAVAADFAEARPLSQNGFKVELGQRLAVRALARAGGLE